MAVPAGVLVSMVQALTPNLPAFIAQESDLDTLLTTTLTTQKQVIRDLIANELIPPLTLLQDVSAFNFGVGRLATLQSDPTRVTIPNTPVNTIKDENADPKILSSPKMLDYKLRRTDDFDIANGARIVADYQNDPGRSWSFPANLAEAKQQYLDLIAQKAFYFRTMAALGASKMADVALAEALAFYRKEGDLVVPMPQSHIDKTLPPFEWGFKFYLSGANPHTKKPFRVLIEQTMAVGLWSADRSEFLNFVEVAPPAAAGQEWEAFVKWAAFLNWHIIIAGLDYLYTKRLNGTVDMVGQINRYVDFCGDLRTANGMTSVRADRVDDLDNQIANLNYSERNGRIVIAPADSVFLVKHILGTALLLAKAAGKPLVHGPFIPPPDSLNYLAYHTSDTRDPVNPKLDKFSWILASAAASLAQLTTKPSYCTDAFFTKVKGLGLPLPQALPNIPPRAPEASDAHAAAARSINAGLTSADLAELGQFVLRAEPPDWGAFRRHRADIAYHARLKTYYGVVAAP